MCVCLVCFMQVTGIVVLCVCRDQENLFPGDYPLENHFFPSALSFPGVKYKFSDLVARAFTEPSSSILLICPKIKVFARRVS